MTPEEIDREAKRIREEYAYMDNMPFEGWMWEFVRRMKDYRGFYEEAKRLRPLFLKEDAKKEDWIALARLILLGFAFFENQYPFVLCCSESATDGPHDFERFGDCYITMPIGPSGGWRYWDIPNANAKYSEFDECINLPPVIRGGLPFRWESEFVGVITSEGTALIDLAKSILPQEKSAIDDWVWKKENRVPRESVQILISGKAKISDDIEDRLIRKLREHRKKEAEFFEYNEEKSRACIFRSTRTVIPVLSERCFSSSPSAALTL